MVQESFHHLDSPSTHHIYNNVSFIIQYSILNLQNALPLMIVRNRLSLLSLLYSTLL